MTKKFLWVFSAVLVGLVACSDDDPSPHTETDTGVDMNMPDAPNTNNDAGEDTSTPDVGNEDMGTDTDVPVDEVRVVCPTPVPQTAAAVCDATPGSGGILMQAAEVLAHDGIYENGYVLIDNSGSIMCTGCDCAAVPAAQNAAKITCSDAVISPGLINAHEHLTFSTLTPPPPSDERYDQRHDWRKGKRMHTRIPSPSDQSREAILFAELRHMLSGTTSIAGSGSTQGLLRNLDDAGDLEGLSGIAIDYETFPLGDRDNGEQLSSGCGYPDIDPLNVLNTGIYMPHIAEGIDDVSRNEYLCLSSSANGGRDLVESNTAVVHGVGLNADDIQDFAASGAKLIWSPRSNVSLYGMTARIPLYHRFGVTMALGTDWSLSGSATMLRELKCADGLNRHQYGELLTDRELWEMATINGAVALGADNQVGALRPGRAADIAVFARIGREAYRAVIEADTTQTALVLRGGEPMVGDANIVEALVPAGELADCEALSICQQDRRVCLKRDVSMTLAEIKNAIDANAYGPFFCGTPPNEPTCVPMRPDEFDGISEPGDLDGDGIVNSQDSCPQSFNPIRPLDNMTQADFDGDMDGDECDVCPLADGDMCPMYNPDDRDGDGVSNLLDNCPSVPNTDQVDADNDDIGDACDVCPNFDNTMATYCPASIYDVRNAVYPIGTQVQIQNGLVTAASGSQFFMQVDSQSGAFNGVDRSGIQVYIANGAVSALPAVGDVVTVVGTISEFGGALQIDRLASVQSTATGQVVTPLTVPVADVKTGGSRASALLGVLIRVADVSVTSSNPDAPSDYQEWEVSGLRVDDLLYAIPSRPAVGEVFTSLTGPLHFSFNNTKILPRDANDIVTGPPALIGVGPSKVFVEANSTGDSMPALEVKLSGPAIGDTTVNLTYTGNVSGPATVVVPDGQVGVSVQLTGGDAGQGTVTAEYDGDMFTANVEVYDDMTVRDVASLTPAMADVVINQNATIRLTLTVPAGTGGLTIDLTTAGGLTAPASVTVAEGDLSVDFDVTAPDTAGMASVSATLVSTVTSNINVVEPSADCVLISEIIEGSGSNNKAVEIFNCTGAPVDLSGFGLCLVSNAATTCSAVAKLSGTVAAGDVATFCRSKASSATDPLPGIVSQCDTTLPTVANFNGDDRLILFSDVNSNGQFDAATDVIADAFGQTSSRPASEIWKDRTYDRCLFTPFDGMSAFNVLDYFKELPNGTTSGFGVPPTEGCN